MGDGATTAVMFTVRPGSLASFGGIDQAIAAREDLVVRLRQFGDQVAALVVGDDALDEAGRQVGGLGDHPDAGLGPVRAGHRAADVACADLNRCPLRAGRKQTGVESARMQDKASAAAPPKRLLRNVMSPSCRRQTQSGWCALGPCMSTAPMKLLQVSVSLLLVASCYFASGSGRTWMCTAIGYAPLPRSLSQGVRSPEALHRPRPFQPAFASSMRASRPLA